MSLGLILSVLFVWLFIQLSKTKTHPEKMSTLNKTGQDVYFLLLKHGFSAKQAKFITAQAAHETGNFTSRIFNENKNLFGMKVPRLRKTYALGENYGHAVFNNIEDCVKDFAIYYKAFRYLETYSSVTSYIDALHKNGYFEAKKEEYEKAVIYFYNLYFANGTV